MGYDEESWKNGVHRILTPDQAKILEIALSIRPGSSIKTEEFLTSGYPKSHRSLVRHLRILQSIGILELTHAGNYSFWNATEYGRWRGGKRET